MSRATHRVGGIVTYASVSSPVIPAYPGFFFSSGANPAYTADELVYQIRVAKATVLFLHPALLQAGLEAARTTGIPNDRIVLLAPIPGTDHLTIDHLIAEGLSHPARWTEPRLKKGEGKTKLAFLLFSSGTTGRPKAVMISHHAVIANCVQMAQHVNLRDATLPNEKKRYAAGDVVFGGTCRGHS